MTNLGIGSDLLSAAGWLYLCAVLAAVLVCVFKVPKWWGKLLSVVAVLTVFYGPLIPGVVANYEHKKRFTEAKAAWDELCKSAGETVNRRVENVGGILLENTRGKHAEPSNALWADAGLPKESNGDDFIYTFLGWEHRDTNEVRGTLSSHPTSRLGKQVSPGYQFVDVRQGDGSITRYHLVPDRPGKTDDFKMVHEESAASDARFAVSFRNLETPRNYWIAGTTVTIADRTTGEVIAQKTWYAFEPGQGSTAGGRQAWRYARSCPAHARAWDAGPTRMFVDQVLKPTARN